MFHVDVKWGTGFPRFPRGLRSWKICIPEYKKQQIGLNLATAAVFLSPYQRFPL